MNAKRLLPGLLIAMAGCGGPSAPPPQPEPEPFGSAPADLTVAAVPVSMRLGLYRNYQPGPPELDDGSPLSVSLLLRVPRRNDFPAQVDEAYIWVRNGNEIWFERLTRKSDPPPGDAIDFTATAGSSIPWPTNIHVDVVIGVRDRSGAVSTCVQRRVLIEQAE